MTTTNHSQEKISDREIIISRVFDAPRELVWEAMTDPKHVVNWWGPRGFTTTTEVMDFRPGGTWKHIMRGPDGTEYPNKSVFVEIVKHERIVYTHAGGKKDAPGAHFEATWTFEALGPNKTRLTLRQLHPSAQARDTVVKVYGAIEGGRQTLERLSEHLAKMESAGEAFVIVHNFNAPRDLVFKMWTDPEHLKHWWGPKDFTLVNCKLDLRPGGLFLYCLKAPNGSEMWGKFIYREIVAPERLVYVNSFSDATGGTTRHPMAATWPLEMLITATFSEQEGRTCVRLESIPVNASEEERKTFTEGHESMRKGYGGMLGQLVDYLEKTGK